MPASSSWFALIIPSAKSWPTAAAIFFRSSMAKSRCRSSETRKPRPNSALSSNSELHQVGPRPSAFLRPRRRRQVAAVNRGAAGGVGDHRAVAEQLRQHFDVRRLAAAGARAAEFKQRAQELLLAQLRRLDLAPVGFRQAEEEIPVLAFRQAQRRLRPHVDGLELRLGLVLGRADVHAERAAGAILGGDLQREFQALEIGHARVGALEGRRSAGQ